jgi:hypothetical protein
MNDLESLTPDLMATTDELLGESITYIPEGQAVRYTWYPLEAAQRIIGKGADRKRLEPRFWRSSGLEAKLGPLIRIRGADGNPLLVVRNVGVSGVAGGSKRPRSLTRSGRPRKGDVLAEIVPIFKGIRATSRAARVFPQRRAREAAIEAVQELRGV